MGTQGWTQADYGQYYLYDTLLDDTTGLFAGATDSNLGTLALLGGLGGGVGGYRQPAPYYGGYAQPAAAPQNSGAVPRIQLRKRVRLLRASGRVSVMTVTV